MRFFWVEERLAWPLVVAISYASIWLIAVDYLWRVLTIQFDTLLLYSIGGLVVGAILIAMVRYSIGTTPRRNT